MSKRTPRILVVVGLAAVFGCPIPDRSIGDLDGETDSEDGSSTSSGPDLGDGDGDGEPGDGDGDGEPGDGDGDGEPGDGDGDGDADGDGDGDGEAAVCGDGVVGVGEECDDGLGNMDPKPGQCAHDCTVFHCVWDVDALSFPINVNIGQEPFGQIAFDGNCDLLVGDGPQIRKVYRVDHVDGSVTEITQLPDGQMTALAYRASDDRIFLGTLDDEYLYALDSNYQLSLLSGEPSEPWYLWFVIAPQSFSAFGDNLLYTNAGHGQIYAYDVEDKSTVVVANLGETQSSAMTFGPDGTLYVGEYDANRISTVSVDGEITIFHQGLDRIAGLAVSPDGTRLFVAHRGNWGQGWIDQLSIPDAVLTPIFDYESYGGSLPAGLLVDGEDHVLYHGTDGYWSFIDYFNPP